MLSSFHRLIIPLSVLNLFFGHRHFKPINFTINAKVGKFPYLYDIIKDLFLFAHSRKFITQRQNSFLGAVTAEFGNILVLHNWKGFYNIIRFIYF
jgi:hypothetical protein